LIAMSFKEYSLGSFMVDFFYSFIALSSYCLRKVGHLQSSGQYRESISVLFLTLEQFISFEHIFPTFVCFVSEKFAHVSVLLHMVVGNVR